MDHDLRDVSAVSAFGTRQILLLLPISSSALKLKICILWAHINSICKVISLGVISWA